MVYKRGVGKILSMITNNSSYVETSSYWTEVLGTAYNKANIPVSLFFHLYTFITSDVRERVLIKLGTELFLMSEGEIF